MSALKWMAVVGIINVVLKLTMAANWTSLGYNGFEWSLITNLKLFLTCGELDGRHRRHQRRLEVDDGGELDQTCPLKVLNIADNESEVIFILR